WILDLYPEFKTGKMVVWLKSNHGCYKLREDHEPTFYVRSRENSLGKMKSYYDEKGFKTEFVRKKTDLYSNGERELLAVNPGKVFDPRDQLEAISFFEGYDKYRFYNVDIPLDQRYLIEKGIKPLSLVEKDDGWKSLEKETTIHYSKPSLKKVFLETRSEGEGYREMGDEIQMVRINEEEIIGDEPDILEQLNEMIARKDPDILLTSAGAISEIPYLTHRAEINDVGLKLGREKSFHPPKNGSWYESYGRVIYKTPSYPLKGRIHIDIGDSFLYEEGGIDGLIEASRISKVPVQRLSKRSPGSLINAMEVEKALEEGHLIPWKKNVSEDFKDSIQLLKADRGGHILEPKVGLHNDVVKLDFASMYPSIIDKYNLSPETLGCSCGNFREVPDLGYKVCIDRRGIIPEVVAPLIERRQEYKKLKDKNSTFKKRAKVLKWLLVTCFGYTGYKKARFNSIEVHESITAYGREILIEAADIARKMGFEVIHGIVDSLWLKGDKEKIGSLQDRVGEKTGLELEMEGVYDWIVFLESRTTGVGALNHYYGVLEDELEVKGLYLRRSDTPDYFKETQREILEKLEKIRGEREVECMLMELIEIVKRRRNELKDRRVDPKELCFTKTASKKAEDYEHTTEMKCALLQYKEMGFPRSPGRSVSYVVTDAKSRDVGEKVKVEEKDPQLYDTAYYEDYLYRVVGEVLSPFGYDRDKIRSRIY
ncbi:MAG: DNA polymerase domain-containing protein, partial [Candidatus Aenigmatarchaeota archaeon]